MSETAYNVEDGTPPPEAPAPEPAAQPAAEPEPQAQAAPEPEGVEVGGQKMVPLAALHAEREQVKALREKAAKVDEVAAWYAQNRPYVDFLQNNPQLLQPRQAAPEPAPTPAKPEDDPQLRAIAQNLDLYEADGSLSVKKAAFLRDVWRTEAKNTAQETVKPLEAMTTRERANVNLREAMQVQMPNGARPNPEILQALWQQGDPKVLATPEGAAAAVAIAIGLGQLNAQPQAPVVQPPAQAPIVTEPAGGRNVNRAPITEFEQRILQTRGISAQKYGDYTRNFKPGDANVLEND